MLVTHQIVTTVLLSLHRTDIYYCTEKKIDNVLTHYKIAVTASLYKGRILNGKAAM